MTATQQRAGIFALLALVMAATRINHFGILPDATWAVFFIAGFYLRGQARWAFPLLMAEAVLVDFVVITNQGMNFFDAYCVSAAYWCLVAAYGAMWLGGSQLRRFYQGLSLASLGIAALSLIVSVCVCHLVAQGSFYWISDSFSSARTFDGWWKNYSDWLLPYMKTAAIYVSIGAALHVLGTLFVRNAAAIAAQRATH
jgi:hypothetical protein